MTVLPPRRQYGVISKGNRTAMTVEALGAPPVDEVVIEREVIDWKTVLAITIPLAIFLPLILSGLSSPPESK